ncbi:MAG: septum site-determining protein MinC [Gallionella sp.]|jgi:septum site-determining protein MinC|nr:septum site-determining protein MinC [Gallionella sp.]MCK9354443.1 septum site-determining protein MinC [Gallionella sp.]
MIREEPAFKIKNGNFPLFVLHVNTTDMDKFKNELETRLTQTPDFFTNTPVVLALAAIADSGVTPDLADLVSFMRGHGMWAAGVLGGSAEQREAAVQAGLGLFPDAPSRRAQPQPETPPEAPLPPPTQQPELPGLDVATNEDESDKNSAAAKTETPQPTTMIIDKPVRTGQRIYAKGGNLVVLAIVNAGAELIADGDIHIYAPLRGRAIAGAHGNENARIFVHRLEAELISIAGCFQVFENGVPENVRGKPAQIRLDGTRLIFEPLPE